MREQIIDILDHIDLWEESMQIYYDSFPEWEREDSHNILENLHKKTYTMSLLLLDGKVRGFYILDINRSLDYALFSFLAIDKEYRGRGFGSKLCLHAIEYFHTHISCDWFFIEAQEKQSKLYARLGFTSLELDYRVPAFNSDASVAMHLMIIQEKEIPQDALTLIVKDIFQRGYSLDADDARLTSQLQRIQEYGK